MTYIIAILSVLSLSCAGHTQQYHKETTQKSVTTPQIGLENTNMLFKKELTKEAIIRAFREAIDFCDTANRTQFSIYLDAPKEKIKALSDEMFVQIKEDNAYLYKNIMTSLAKDEALYKVVSSENDMFEISFAEKGNESLTIMISFSYDTNDVLRLHKINTL